MEPGSQIGRGALISPYSRGGPYNPLLTVPVFLGTIFSIQSASGEDAPRMEYPNTPIWGVSQLTLFFKITGEGGLKLLKRFKDVVF